MKKIQVLGAGCYRCDKLAENAAAAAKALGLEYELVRVTDIPEIVKFGVLRLPALVVDGTVKVAGKVPPPEALKQFLA